MGARRADSPAHWRPGGVALDGTRQLANDIHHIGLLCGHWRDWNVDLRKATGRHPRMLTYWHVTGGKLCELGDINTCRR